MERVAATLISGHLGFLSLRNAQTMESTTAWTAVSSPSANINNQELIECIRIQFLFNIYGFSCFEYDINLVPTSVKRLMERGKSRQPNEYSCINLISASD